jgi:hypothetical protein
MRRVDGEDLAHDEPVEQHADRRQVLLDGWPGRGALLDRSLAGLRHLQCLDIRSDVERLDIREFANAMLLEPGEERTRGPVIGHPGVVVLDRGGEKIEETARRAIAGVGYHRRHDERTAQRRRRDRCRGLDHCRQVGSLGAHADTLL